MTFKPNEFTAQISKTGGVALTSDFWVTVDPPAGLLHLANEPLSYRIDSISFPPRSVTEINYSLYGPPMKIGATLNYVPITMTIIMSPDLRERNFFLEWQDLIGGSHRKAVDNSSTDKRKEEFNIGFYDDYVSKQGVTIEQYDRSVEDGEEPKVLYKAHLMDAYPSMVAESTMSWQSTDVLRQSITISYRYFTDEFIGRPVDANISTGDSLFTRLNKSGAGGLINMGAGRLAEKVGTKATAAAIFAAGKLMK